jgi:MoxR-like ATPase
VTPERLETLRGLVRQATVDPVVQHYLVDVVRRTRQHPAVALGGSTRAAVALLRASRAWAAGDGRSYVIPDDVKALAPWVLAHRLVLRPEAQLENIDAEAVVREILASAPVPRLT